MTTNFDVALVPLKAVDVKHPDNYLDLPPTKSWSVDSLIQAIGRLER